MADNTLPAIWNPDKCLDGVFCPKCDYWMDDYYGQPDKCTNCGQKMSGWVDGRKKKGEKK